MILFNDRNRRLGFLVGRQGGLRSTDEIVEQLRARIRQLEERLQAERSQHAFAIEEMQRQIIELLRDLAEERYKSARRDREEAFARAPSPSTMMH
jgi:Skp family chaperone for outer membrane proteins